MGGARRVHDRRSRGVMRHADGSIFPCVARQHSKEPGATQSWSTSATIWCTVIHSLPSPLLAPRKTIMGGQREGGNGCLSLFRHTVVIALPLFVIARSEG